MSNENTIYNDELTASTQEHATISNVTGRVHTVEIEINDRPDINIDRDLGDKRRPKFISSWRIHANSNHKTASGRFNANAESVCMSLAQFEDRLCRWAEKNGFDRTDIFTPRVDFALDVYDPNEAPKFKKYVDLLIYCYVVKYGVRPRDMYWSMCPFLEIEKSLKVDNNKGFVLERYNKQLQDERHNAIWRFEVRSWRDLQNKPKNTVEHLRDLLIDIANELTSLPTHYDEALITLAKNQRNKFNQMQAATGNKLLWTQFLAQRDDRVFSRGQIRTFLQYGDDPNAKKNADNYVDAWPHLFVSRRELEAFANELKQHIMAYLNA